MSPDEMAGRRAFERAGRSRPSPDDVIQRTLAERGIRGEWSSPEFREAYLAIERVYRRLYQERTDPLRCARCGEPTSRQGANLCRECWLTRGEWEEAAA